MLEERSPGNHSLSYPLGQSSHGPVRALDRAPQQPALELRACSELLGVEVVPAMLVELHREHPRRASYSRPERGASGAHIMNIGRKNEKKNIPSISSMTVACTI